MYRFLFLFSIFLIAGPVSSGIAGDPIFTDWAECALEKLPGVADDQAAGRILGECKRRWAEPMKKTSGCGSYSVEDCVKARAKGSESEGALARIREACGAFFSPEMSINPAYAKPEKR